MGNECLEEDRGEMMRDPDDRGLAQIAGNGGRRDKGKGLAQISKKGTEPPKAVNGGFLAQTAGWWPFGGDGDGEENSISSEEESDVPAITSADNLAQQSAESRTETPAQFVLYRGDTGYVSSDSQEEEDDDDISQAAYLGSSRGGNLAQIGQQSDSVESGSEELSSEELSSEDAHSSHLLR